MNWLSNADETVIFNVDLIHSLCVAPVAYIQPLHIGYYTYGRLVASSTFLGEGGGGVVNRAVWVVGGSNGLFIMQL